MAARFGITLIASAALGVGVLLATASAQPGPGAGFMGPGMMSGPGMMGPGVMGRRGFGAMGNPGQHADVRGLIFPAEASGWFAIVSWDAAGYVKDDDAKEWNAEELLQSYRDGTEAANAERQKAGATPIEVVGWAEKPAYDAGTHRLVWAMSLRDQGAAADAEQSVNYNTYALGREGYLSLNLVTDLKDLPAHRAAAQQLLGAIRYNEGKRYADFDSSTDKVAEYGLAALVLGVGAKKLGLFAVAAAFLLKFAKVFLIGGIALLGVLGKFLKRGDKPSPT